MKPYLLVLENFQSIRERTEIPIRSLNFLYGPNSAGKSCIDDAFSLLAAVFSKSKVDPDSMFTRWTRSEMAAVGQDEYLTARIELHCFIGRIFGSDSRLGEYMELVERKKGLIDWFEKNKWNIVLGLEGHDYGVSKITLACGSETVFCIDLDRPDYDIYESIEISLKAFGQTYRELADKHGVAIKGKSYKFACDTGVMSPPLSFRPELGSEDFERDIVAIVNAMLVDMTRIPISPRNLGADRSTIKDSSLNIICCSRGRGSFGGIGLPREYFSAPVLELGMNNDSNFEFIKQLAQSSLNAAHEEINRLSNVDTQYDSFHIERQYDDVESTQYIWYRSDEMLHEYVNRCLREHLFLDQVYQLIFDALEIKPATDINVPPLTAALMIGYLVDKAGRRMTFEDVGTGISCVIPVLVTVHSGSGFIQQPELHLHPALQSALGDVFVEAIQSNSAYHFIETHSEYILLRCLRRIRETSAGKHPDGSPLSLKPDDLSVLYFEPQPEGFTKVKSIRVSTQGDFIDRWPRGFFEERGKELFDE